MSIIQRPGKEGNATTYQGKVAAGYTKILASEVDADIDTMYSAWNAGVDTVNIKDASVTQSKLAAGAVGGAQIGAGAIQTANLADAAVTTPKLADGSVTDSKVANVSWAKLAAPVLGSIPFTPRGLLAADATYIDLYANVASSPQYNPAATSWGLRLDYAMDQFQVWRLDASGWKTVFTINALGQLPALSVDHQALAVNAANGASVAAPCPANFLLSTANQWTTLVTLPSITTRGGWVHLSGDHGLSVTGPVGGAICNQRWTRDGAQIVAKSFNVTVPAGTYVPFPGLHTIDNTAVAGAHVYAYQVFVAPSCLMIGSTVSDGWLQAVEIG